MHDVPPPTGHPGDGRGVTRSTRRGRLAREAPRHRATGDGNAAGNDRAGDGPGDDGDAPAPRRHWARTLLEWVGVIGAGVLIAITAQALLVQAFWIPSPSMTPTLEVGDRVLVNKLSYRVHDVHRGDVVVFDRPPSATNGTEGEIPDLIKRVVGVGGDTVEARGGHLYVNGERIEEPYLGEGTTTGDLPRQLVPEGTVFVMGDNRDNSEDSRIFGPIDEDSIVGRAFVVVLPLSDLGWL